MKISGFHQAKPSSISYNHVITQTFHQHEDVSLAVWALFQSLSHKEFIRSGLTRPIRPSMRPHIWLNNSMMTWLYEILLDFLLWLKTADFHWYSRKRDQSIDAQTDQQTNWPSYRDARRHLVNLLEHLFAQKLLIFLVFDESVTDGRTDGPTNGPTDGQTLL